MIEQLRVDYAAATSELLLCRVALRQERVARWRRERALATIAAAREPVERSALLRLAGPETKKAPAEAGALVGAGGGER